MQVRMLSRKGCEDVMEEVSQGSYAGRAMKKLCRKDCGNVAQKRL